MLAIKRVTRLVLCVLAVFLGQWLTTPDALAADRVTLKDGKVVEGSIIRELDGNVWIKVSVSGIEQERFYAAAEVKGIEREAPVVASETEDAHTGALPPPVPVTGARPGVPRAAVITLGDEVNGNIVGVYMTADILKRAIPELERELGTDGTGIVVLRVHSGGGLLLEVQKLSDIIHNEYKKRWRTVGWIDSAISAAAMTAHCLEEVYFTSQGNYGACTAFAGTLDAAVEDRPLEEILAQMERISARGGHNPLIMRSMQIQDPLSATITRDGDVRYFPDLTSGEFIVNRDKEILTFNANSAAKVKFSRGTADTLPALTKLLGYQEIDWVGDRVKTVPWPVSKAEKMQMDYRRKVHDDEELTAQYFDSYNINIEAAQGAQDDTRAKFVGKAKVWLQKIKDMVRNNPNQALLKWGGEEEYKKWLEQQEKLMRDLTRR